MSYEQELNRFNIPGPLIAIIWVVVIAWLVRFALKAKPITIPKLADDNFASEFLMGNLILWPAAFLFAFLYSCFDQSSKEDWVGEPPFVTSFNTQADFGQDSSKPYLWIPAGVPHVSGGQPMNWTNWAKYSDWVAKTNYAKIIKDWNERHRKEWIEVTPTKPPMRWTDATPTNTPICVSNGELAE